jgi:arsenite/tail-anchored protein-transporting ATPase
MAHMLALLAAPPRFLFFTGKGGVGKTALSCATAIALADSGKRVLLVSTDPASNLDEMLATKLDGTPRAVTGVPRLDALNIDPEAAAEAYRTRVLAPYQGVAPAEEIASIREQLSGACTVEIAAFDSFAGLLAGGDGAQAYDHVIFDTAPTGHTLRLLSLPRAWTGFLEDNTRGASCLGPHSGLTMRKERFAAALRSLGDRATTEIVLVSRPETSALREAARAAEELRALGLANQRLVVNGRFRASDPGDSVATALEARGSEALAAMPPALATLPRDEVALRPFDMVGIAALRALLDGSAAAPVPALPAEAMTMPSLRDLVDALAAPGRGLIMVMGKGGVGKTTIAAAIAVELAARGHAVHLTTTDPAAHVAGVVAGALPGLRVDRIDPKAETEAYVAKTVAARGAALDADGKRLLIEDLRSPCTEEVAVFHAFARIVAEARAAFVVLDTAPTGHTLLLMDATGAYHRQVSRDAAGKGRLVTPLMRLQDPDYTRIVLVTLPETTPVSEAAALQADLRRARIEPFAWVVNASLAKSGARDPLLAARIAAEQRQFARVAGLAARHAVVGWAPQAPVGASALRALLDADSHALPAQV